MHTKVEYDSSLYSKTLSFVAEDLLACRKRVIIFSFLRFCNTALAYQGFDFELSVYDHWIYPKRVVGAGFRLLPVR